MPYHYTIPEPSISSTSWDFTAVSQWGGYDLPQFHQNPGFGVSYDKSRERRGGSNSQPSLQRKVRSVPKIKIRKKIIGYENVNYVKKFYKFVGGKRIEKKRIVSYYKPIFLRYADLRSVATSADILSAKSQPLYPNRLSYARQNATLTPNPLKGSMKLSSPFGGAAMAYVGTWEVNGPGQHQITPAFMGFYTGTAELLSAITPPGSVDSDQALYKLYKKVGSSTPSLLTAIGEAPELIKTIGDVLAEGLKLAHALLRLNLKYVTKRVSSTLDLKAISQLWLTWVYGINPALSDVQAALEAMQNSEKLWRVYKASVSNETFTSSDQDPHGVTDYFYGVWNIAIKDTSKYGVLLTGRLSFDKYIDTKVKTFAAVVSTSYELIPFSFMLDWFIDIGGYLSSAKILSDQEYVAWETKTRTYTDYWYGYLGQSHYNPGDEFISPVFRAAREYFVCEREVLSELPGMPLPSLARIDNLFDMSTISRSINALAIAITRTR